MRKPNVNGQFFLGSFSPTSHHLRFRIGDVRWSKDAAISLKAPPTTSSRYLSEGAWIQLADALQLGKGLCQIAAEEDRRKPAAAGCDHETPSRTMEPQADQSPAADRFPGTARDERRARKHLSGLVSAAHHRAVPGNDPSPRNRTPRAPDPPPRDETAFALLSGPLLGERPSEVANRLIPGHWDGDLVCATFNRSAIATLVERTTGMLILVHLNGKRDTGAVRERVGHAMSALPTHLRKSLTWNQGSEMAEYLQFQTETTIPVYSCDPHSPWQRGTNENITPLLRQHFPEGTDLNLHGSERPAEVAAKINARPRESRNWESAQAHFDRPTKTAAVLIE